MTRWRPRRTVHGEALALVVAFIAAYEVLEVVLGISNRANFVILVDEVAVSQGQQRVLLNLAPITLLCVP